MRLGEWQGVDQVELSIIVTQYRKEDSKDLTHYRYEEVESVDT